ncbi:MAG TPA: hypothetical protein VFE10_18590, partial [Phenylobacterium sp.]|nr:hypothetical protein [Phenylobacterium sp.]
MRSIVFAVAAAALLLSPQAGALAQDDGAPPAKHAAPGANLPKAPIPYVKLHPKPAKPKPKPGEAATTRPATAATPASPKAAPTPAAQAPIVHA